VLQLMSHMLGCKAVELLEDCRRSLTQMRGFLAWVPKSGDHAQPKVNASAQLDDVEQEKNS